jgi:uncharacterized protein
MPHAPEIRRGVAESRISHGPGPRLRLYWKARGFPKVRSTYTITTNVSVRMSDGVVLQADLYRPIGKPKALTVLVRTPYSRGLASTFAARFFAAQGFNVLVQSVRGTSGSGGEFQPMIMERTDGLDTVEWMRTQEWFDRRFVTYGQSYLTYTQWAIAEDPPAELKGMMLDVGPDDFSESIYGRGPMDLIDFIGWSATMSRRGESQAGALKTLRTIREDAKSLRRLLTSNPLRHSMPASFDKQAPWYAEWLRHPDVAEEFWEGYRFPHALRNVRFPVLLDGSWPDLFLRQTLRQWQVLHERGTDLQVRISNDIHMSAKKLFDGTYFKRCLAWIDGVDRGAARVSKSASYEVRVGGSKHEVRSLEKWPPASQDQVLFPTGDGHLASVPTSRSLTRFTFDPAHPTPSVGGHTITDDAGFQLNDEIERRDDVLIFTGDRLEADLLVIGHPACVLELASTNPDHDLFVRLCDVDGRGHSRNVTDEIVRFTGDDAAGDQAGSRAVSVTLQGTAHRFKKDHRVRVQVSGGAFPRYSVNKGGAKGNGSSVTHTIQLGIGTATRVVLQVVEVSLPR